MANETTPQAGHYVQANGLQIYYEESGSGAPLLLIHGGNVNLSMWAAHIPLFAQHFRVIAPDSRGHGRTKNPLDTLSCRLLADDMAALIHALALDKPWVCGYSDGGQIALELAIHYPQLSRGYVVGGATHRLPAVLIESAKSFGISGPGIVDFEQVERTQADFVTHLRHQHDTFQGDNYWKTYLRHASHMWLAPLNYTVADFEKIREPILILLGDRDATLVPVELAVEMYRLIPQAELAIVPGADHSFPFVKVELFMELIIDFISRHQATTQS